MQPICNVEEKGTAGIPSPTSIVGFFKMFKSPHGVFFFVMFTADLRIILAFLFYIEIGNDDLEPFCCNAVLNLILKIVP